MSQSWSKAHSNINWENKPSTKTPINETNLNKMDKSIDAIDDRVITLDSVKTDEVQALQLIQNVSFNEKTGIFTFTRKNGTTFQIDTLLEKVVINFDYDDNPSSPHYQNLIITLEDGTVKYIDLSALITQYEFDDSTDIRFEILQNGHVKAYIIDGSITESKLQPNYLADIKVQVSETTKNATAAAESEKNAKLSEEVAVDAAMRAGASEQNAKDSEDNAFTYSINAKESELNAAESEKKAKTSEVNAKDSELKAKDSETIATASEISAKISEVNAKESETNAKLSENDAKASADSAKSSEDNAKNLVQMAIDKLLALEVKLDENGHLYYKEENGNVQLRIVPETGHLEFTIVI